MIDKINQAQYSWLQFATLEFANSNYENIFPVDFAERLKYVFSDLQTGLDKNLSTIPGEYQLEQNYPNPFNPSSTISYSLPNRSMVSLSVFDALGREVSKLVNQEQPQGNYDVLFDAADLSSGIYLYRMRAGQFIETKKMVLLK